MADEMQTEKLADAERIELNMLRARMAAVVILTKNLSECQEENETLRNCLAANDQALLRLQNRMECFASSGISPPSSRAFISDLLSDNQRLQQHLVQLEHRFQVSNGGDSDWGKLMVSCLAVFCLGRGQVFVTPLIVMI